MIVNTGDAQAESDGNSRLCELTLRKEALEREIAVDLGMTGLQNAPGLDSFAYALDSQTAVMMIVQTAVLLEIREREVVWSPRYEAFIAKMNAEGATQVHRASLGDVQVVDDAILNWRTSINARRGYNATRSEKKLSRAPQNIIRKVVLGPVDDLLQGISRLFVLPDGAFHGVPWSAIPGRMSRYLFEEIEVIVVNDVSQLSATIQSIDTPVIVHSESLLAVVSDVDFGAARPLGQGDSCRGSFYPLPHTGPEGELICSLFPALSEHIQGLAAKKNKVMALIERAEFCHFATHAFCAVADSALDPVRRVEERNPFFLNTSAYQHVRRFTGRNLMAWSGIALAGAAFSQKVFEEAFNCSGYHGVLTAEEITSLALHRVRLVVLSACDTSLGKVVKSEGPFSLVRAFRQAGVPCVVATLWQISDAQTPKFMGDFYKQMWRGGLSISQAMQRTLLTNAYTLGKEEFIAENTWGTATVPPLYWAGFSIFG